MPVATKTVKIFFCYAHEDEELLNKLKRQIRPLQRQGLIDVWHDRDISAGTEWEQEIYQHLNSAQIILLLVSPDFMASDYCYSIEMKRAIERHERGEARVIPIILRPVYWQGELGKFQALPTDGKPVTDRHHWHNIDEAFLDVAKGIREAVETIAVEPSTTSRSVIGHLPLTDPRTIQQREQTVKDIYAKLTQRNITALVLTGIGGIGKSTLAALVYQYAEDQRRIQSSPFTAEALWLKIDESVTMTDLGGTLLEVLGKALPVFGRLDPQSQALALSNALNTTDKARLIVLDQFENLLDWETGKALPNRPGISEWLDILNSEKCTCRVLLTSRPRPQGTHPSPMTYMQEYSVKGMDIAEGRDLLRKQGVTQAQGTDAELRTAVERSSGHALALTLLATLLHDHNLNLNTLFKDPAYEQLWTGDIATNLLDQIYTHRLSEAQRELLLAFSVYREPVLLDAAVAVINKPLKAQVPLALKALLTQHLLEAVGEGRYQLHAIVANYAHHHFDESGEQANQQVLQTAHAKAAQYYLQQAAKSCPPREKRRSIKDVELWIEATWQYSQAEQWQAAYNLMQQESILHDLKIWGGNDILLELCEPLLTNGWNLERSQAAWIHYYLGWVYHDLGTYEQAFKHYEQALQISRKVGNRDVEGNAFNGLGAVYGARGKHEEGLKYYEQALQISRKVGNRDVEGRSLNNLGYAYKALGRHGEALKYFEEALPIRKEITDQDGESRTLNGLGSVYRALEKEEEALKCYKEALHLCREIGNRGWEAISLLNIGKLYSLQRRYDTALACFLLARNICEEILSPGRDKVQKWIDNLDRKVGEQQFAALLAKAEPQASQIVEMALLEELGEAWKGFV